MSRRLLDDYTERHFRKWLDVTIGNDAERLDTERAMRDFMADHPEVAGDRSWPEVRQLAERSL